MYLLSSFYDAQTVYNRKTGIDEKATAPMRLTTRGFTYYRFFKPVRIKEWFDAETVTELQEYWRKVSRFYLMVVPEPPPGNDKEKRNRRKRKRSFPPPWVQTQQQEIKKHLKAKGQLESHRPIYQMTVIYPAQEGWQYYANVWVHGDVEGKRKNTRQFHCKKVNHLTS